MLSVSLFGNRIFADASISESQTRFKPFQEEEHFNKDTYREKIAQHLVSETVKARELRCRIDKSRMVISHQKLEGGKELKHQSRHLPTV